MYLGAQGGAMASIVNFSPVVYQTPLHSYLSPTAGLVYRYVGHKVCGLQVELNWMQRGWQQHSDELGVWYQRRQDYVEMPLLCHLYFGKRARGFINLGPQIGYLLHEEWTGELPEGFDDAWTEGGSRTYHQYAPAEKRFDWGLAGGLGFYYRSKKAGAYQLEARFNYSLGTVFANSQMDYFASSNAMNLSLCFAYMWQFKGNQ